MRASARLLWGVMHAEAMAAAALVTMTVAGTSAAQTTTLVSVAVGGGWASGDSYDGSVSDDGRYVAFSSDASDLVSGDTNGTTDVFVRDRMTGTTTIASVTSSGVQANDWCSAPAISGNGRFVAFASNATNLVPGDTNDKVDVFLRDLQAGTTVRVSVSSSGGQAEDHSSGASISHDGTVVGFQSSASNLVADDTNNFMDVFVHDVSTAITSRASVATGGAQAAWGSSGDADVSGNGRFVAFTSEAIDLVPMDTNGTYDVFVHDRLTGTTTRASVDSAGRQAIGGHSWESKLNGDGRYLVFSSLATTLVTGDTNATSDVFVRDLLAGTTRRVNLGPGGAQAERDPSGRAGISGDGRLIAFYSSANDLVPDSSFQGLHIYVTDIALELTADAIGVSYTIPTRGLVSAPALSSDGRHLVFHAGDGTLTGDSNAVGDVFMRDLDSDGDGLLAPWETAFGLNPLVASGNDGADGDPDGDSRTNAQEQADGTHPRGFYTRYLAEGATSSFFDTRIALLSTGEDTTTLLRFQKGDGTRVTRVVTLNGFARATVDAKQVAGLATAEFATIIESDRRVVADRLMTWDATGYGSHAETAVATPSTTWYLAEGATHHNFNLFYLLQNPNAIAVPVTVTYLLPAPAAPLTKLYTVPAQTRFNIWVNNEGATDPALAALAATDVSAVFTAPHPILVERAMYLNQAGPDGTFGTSDDVLFSAGHESAGVPDAALTWFLAEGATGPNFDEFLLIANPSPTAALVEARYLLGDGTVLTKDYVVPAASRFNTWVNEEDFPGLGKALANMSLSVALTSTNGVPIIVERAMWWPRPSPLWREAHNSAGATATGTVWGLAEGEAGGPFATETYILVANTSPYAGTARVTLVIEGGGTQVVTVPLPASSRTNVPVIEDWFPGITGKRFGALIESVGNAPAQIVVERAMYSDANGVHWAAGSNATATWLVP